VADNVLTGPMDTTNVNKLSSGIKLDWACGSGARQVRIERNDILSWNLAGMYVSQSFDVDVTCNRVTGNRRSLDFTRNTEPTQAEVRFKENRFEGHTEDGGIQTDNALKLVLGPLTSTTGNNVLKTTDGWYMIYENDESSANTLNALRSKWFIDGSFTTDTTRIHTRIGRAPGVSDPDRVAVAPVTANPALPPCASQGALPGRQQAILDDAATPDEAPTPSSEPVLAKPTVTELGMPRPNPTSGRTDLAFSVASDGVTRTSVRIYDVQGRRVRQLVDRDLEAGFYKEPWDGRDEAGLGVAAGIYFVRFVAGPVVQTRKVVLLR
jgi:hypothetical protein